MGISIMEKQYAVRDRNSSILFKSDQFEIDLVTYTVPLSDGAELLICGTDEDEEIGSLQEKLREANDANIAKESFLSNMSHDIRTPMNAIVGMTALAKKHIDEKSRVADALNKIDVASSHLLSLINDVLDMSRINSGKMTVNTELFSLSDLLHDVLVIVRPQMAEKNHSFDFKVGSIDAEYLYGDALRIRQVLVNIINNSVKYTEANGKLSLYVTEDVDPGNKVRLIFTCADNGIGMSEEFLKKIFEPFERVNSTTVSRIEGTGLGMSIVKKTVEAMGGEISIESALGEGTTVTVSLPLTYEVQKLETGPLKDKNILIIEGESSAANLFTKYLGEAGARCEIVASASDAVSAITDADFHGKSYQAVTIGQQLAEGDSVFGISSYLHRSYPELVLVLCSLANWEEIEYQANRNGIHHFIPRPFFRKSLINGLSSALQGKDDETGGSGAYPDLTGKHILLVEDNLINREIAKELLAVTHAEVETAENGKDAVEMFSASDENWYSMILMDIQMPVMNGYQAAEAIRAEDRPDAMTVPIYAMTANTFAEDIARARESGMNGHLAKPIDINALMHTLHQAK